MDEPTKKALLEEYQNHLSSTQRRIVDYVYRGHPEADAEIELDLIFGTLERKIPGQIASDAELYYRLKDLVAKGFLRLKTLGQHATVVVPIPEVANLLRTLKPKKT